MTAQRRRRTRFPQGHLDEPLHELVHDPYQVRMKLTEPSACSSCGAIYRRGRWSWKPAPADARQVLCPACQRIRDRVPAGYLTLSGDFLAEHRAEIRGLVHNIEARERAEHPLKRLMDMTERNGTVTLTFTDPRLARAIGTALYEAYDGELDYSYVKDEYMLRVRWTRERKESR